MEAQDPRPDLAYDSDEWAVLLAMAEDTDQTVAGVLHGFRCGGLRLHRGAKGYALRPDYDPTTSAWATQEEYVRDRDEWLVPHTETIVGLLKRLTDISQKLTA